MATAAQKARLLALTPDQAEVADPAGEPICARLTTAAGDGESLVGLKIVSDTGWFAARPSGTGDIYKINAESFLNEVHLLIIQKQAGNAVTKALDHPCSDDSMDFLHSRVTVEPAGMAAPD